MRPMVRLVDSTDHRAGVARWNEFRDLLKGRCIRFPPLVVKEGV